MTPFQEPSRNGGAEADLHSESTRTVDTGKQQDNFFLTAPAITLPTGGGAIRGIDEKLSVSPATGTASLAVPIAVSPGRQRFAPQLQLSYDSGAGNGPYGLGWQLSVPSVRRKTSQGLPQYMDGEDSDIFLLSGAEDLLPVLTEQPANAGTEWTQTISTRTEDEFVYTVRRYRPRTEGLFARIERWERVADSDLHWRATTRDNVRSVYGRSTGCRIADPADTTRVFEWLIEESCDDKGNLIRYEYAGEDGANVDSTAPQERNRKAGTYCNRLLKRIHYGNRTPSLDDWLFEVVFDYDEEHMSATATDGQTDILYQASTEPKQAWKVRQDPFSSWKSRFDIRTYRLCRRVLVFHRFDELTPSPLLVRSTDFTYQEGRALTYLTSVEQCGYEWDEANQGYRKASLPPLEFSYSAQTLSDEVLDVDTASLDHFPAGLSGSNYRWVDLYGEGMNGILSEADGVWTYKRNLGGGQFAAAAEVPLRPSSAALAAGGQQILDLAGDGRKDLVLLGPTAGFYEADGDTGWANFQALVSVPNVNWQDPNLRFADLNGDGLADVLITEDEAFVWYSSEGEAGFNPAERVPAADDEEAGPRLVFADASQSIYMADMSGDGLSDLVRIRNGDVCYWPNTGYGNFGAKITMDNAPLFDRPEQFDQRRIRLADIDGTGTTDIFYLATDRICFWYNQAGNRWSETQQLNAFPPTDSQSSTDVLDFLGNGTACIVWSSPLPCDTERPLRYIDLMGGRKPHLLERVVNNMGAETRLAYAPSTQFWLADWLAGTPWITRLHFPVHVVEQMEVREAITGTKLVTRYAYHHGYFDGEEHEFRGFGRVEQWDTESYEAFAGTGLFTSTPKQVDREFYLPPVYTKTWFHTGAYFESDTISRQYSGEYYNGDASAAELPDTILPEGLEADEERQAARALRGRMLRQEIYALDGSDAAEHPYSATESNYTIRRLQPAQDDRYAVFLAHARETLAYHYERNPEDPRVAHDMTLQVDDFGNVEQAAAIVYPRRSPMYDEQARTLITYTVNRFTNAVDEGDAYRTPAPCEAQNFELTGLSAPAAIVYEPEELLRVYAESAEIPFEEITQGANPEKRCLAHTRTQYFDNDLSGPLPLGQMESLALPWQAYRKAFNASMIATVLEERIDDAVLTTEGGYVTADDAWWTPSGRQEFDPTRFYLPVSVTDPFGNTRTISYDPYVLLVTQIRDPEPIGNTVTAAQDYRTLQPFLLTDPNGNRSEVRFDPLGMVIATAVMGKQGEAAGDTLDGFQIVQPLQPGDAVADPHTYLQLATSRFVYDLNRYRTTGLPVYAHAIVRETHVPDLTGTEVPAVQQSLTFYDGLKRTAMKKVQAEPGPIPCLGIAEDVSPRWVGTGRVVYDNKSHPVKQYEPFFSTTFDYEDEEALAACGVTPILRYDPLGRLIRTDQPDGSFSKTGFDAWSQTTWDRNDTVRDSAWYQERGAPAVDGSEPSDPVQRAAFLAARHHGTPAVVHLDTLGRTFLTIADNGNAERYETRTLLDVQGSPLGIIDARGNAVMTYTVMAAGESGNSSTSIRTHDMLARPMYQLSMDAGARRKLADIGGKPIRMWDSRGHTIRTSYDVLRRPTHLHVEKDGTEILAERTVYGEALSGPETLNQRGRVYRVYDGAGVATNEAYDFKGNLLRSSRTLAREYKQTPDWSAVTGLIDPVAMEAATAALLESETFPQATAYDALNRTISETLPDNTEIARSYNSAGLLESVQARLRGEESWTPFVENIDYNARGQRETILYGNAVTTAYTYDAQTFRLTRLKTTRDSDGDLQNLSYVYDPVGNVMSIGDTAQQTIYFANTKVSPDAFYKYDALYRLVLATGREHIGQNSQPDETDPPWYSIPHTNDGEAMRRYTESYAYDAVGNILEMKHTARNGGWTRLYQYEATSNRLLSTSVPEDDAVAGNNSGGMYSDRYEYDAHGNMTRMPHLGGGLPSPNMQWDYQNQLCRTAVGSDAAAFYVYDGRGRRVRKVWEKSPGSTQERIYVGALDIFRMHPGSIGVTTARLERTTSHVIDDTERIALVETCTLGKEPSLGQLIRFQLSNHLGSATVEVDNEAQIISYEEYAPYGSSTYQAVRTQTMTGKRYRYTWKERDEETGLYYYGARYYGAWLGRWTSCDPQPDTRDGESLFVAMKSNPIKNIDPDGAAPVSAVGVNAPAAPLSSTPPVSVGPPSLEALPGGGAGNGIPRGTFRLVPQGSTAGTALAAGDAALAVGAGVAATGSLVLFGVTLRAAVRGEETPIEVADKSYGTHFADLYGWFTGEYSQQQAPIEASSKRDDSKERQAFRAYVVNTILDGCNGSQHPLRNLLDADGNPYNARDMYDPAHPTFDAGHLVSIAGGGKAMGVEQSVLNRRDGSKSEKRNVVFQKPFVNVCGVPISVDMLKALEAEGLVPKGTLASATPSAGWTLEQGLLPTAGSSAPMVTAGTGTCVAPVAPAEQVRTVPRLQPNDSD